MDACRNDSEHIYIHLLAPLFRRSQPLHILHLPDRSRHILSTRSQLRNSPTLARQGRQT
jgi:hypothetical protein